MIIDSNIKKYVRYYEESIQNAVKHLTETKGAIICAVNEHNLLKGVFTRGDLMRWLLSNEVADLKAPLSSLLKDDYIFVNEKDPVDRIESLLEKVAYIPVIDGSHHLVGVARHRDKKMQIAERNISEDDPVFIIAEIGINHNGDFELARKLIDASVEAGADCAKFQMRDLASLYSNAGNPDDSRENLGSQYTLDLLSRFELPADQMLKLFDYCKQKGIIPLCTPWDESSLKILEDYGMEAYKVSSADMTNHYLLDALLKTKKPLICSTGMADEVEIKDTIALLKEGAAQYILLQCNSTYPAPYKDVNLKYMNRLQTLGDCLVGYSGHERGYHIPVAAVAMGAKVIEKHITMDKTMEGNDHKVSLLPHEFKSMVDSIRQLEESIGTDNPRQITQGERMNRSNLAKSLVINCDLNEGDEITEEMIEVKSPGRGLQPNYAKSLIGRNAKRNFKKGDFFYPADLEDDIIKPRFYKFKRPFGVPVRYHDYKVLMKDTNPDFLEFHLSYKDMDQDLHKYFDTIYKDIGLVVHSPDLFTGDHLLNLASDDPEHRKRSVAELQRVVHITKELHKYFPAWETPLIVVSLGGFSSDGFVDRSERPAMYERIADSLDQIDKDGVEIIGQTLPPFPWYFGGQLYLNLFVDAVDTAEFSKKYGHRLCLDISHSKLACNHFNWSFKEFVDTLGPYIAHLHIVDAAGVDSEGIQIDEGEVDFTALGTQLESLAPHASFIPEIWQGHENDGEGFWVALSRLEGKF